TQDTSNTMLLLWVLVVGVCGVAQGMEGPRGKVTREMCSKPASMVPEEHWPYCCEGHGMLCEDFAASCYLNCQPVVSSGHDVTLVEERPGFCCALYNFCCAREFSRIGDLQQVTIDEQFPSFHRFHVPAKQAPRRSPPPRKNIVRQDIGNDISEIPVTVNRVGRTRQPSRNNQPQVQSDRFNPKSAKSLEDVDNISLGVSRPKQSSHRFNPKPNVVKPQRSQVRFPPRPQNNNVKVNDAPTSSGVPESNFGQLQGRSIQSDDSFGNIAHTKKTVIKTKNSENVEDRKIVEQNSQQLNLEAENRKITLNRAAVTQIEKQSKNNPGAEAVNTDNQEKLTPIKQIKRVSIPRITKSRPETKPENNSKEKQIREEKEQRTTTEQPTTVKSSNGRKIKVGRRVLVRTAQRKINNSEQENSKSVDSVQNKQEVKPNENKRTIVSSRQTGSRRTRPTTTNTNENTRLETKKEASNVPAITGSRRSRPTVTNTKENTRIETNREESNVPDRTRSITGSRRSRPSATNTNKNTGLETKQEESNVPAITGSRRIRPTATKTKEITRLETNQEESNVPAITGSRRIRPTATKTKEITRLETNQEESNVADKTGSNNNGRRIKQTVRRVNPVRKTEQNSIKLATSTIKQQPKVQPERIISNNPAAEKSPALLAFLEQQKAKITALYHAKADSTSDPVKDPLHTADSLALPSLNKEVHASKIDFNSSAIQFSENKKIGQNNLKNSQQEKDKKETTSSPKEIDETDVITEIPEKNTNQLGNEVNEDQEEIVNSSSNSDRSRPGRTRSRATIPTIGNSSRNKATSFAGENSAVTSTRTSSRTRGRISRTRNQEPILEAIPSSSSTSRGTSRSGRTESFGRKDVSKTPVETNSENIENTARQTTRRRGRRST
ncbi:unnamed protein product, partial [Meganyctiphanes norvegica]